MSKYFSRNFAGNEILIAFKHIQYSDFRKIEAK